MILRFQVYIVLTPDFCHILEIVLLVFKFFNDTGKHQLHFVITTCWKRTVRNPSPGERKRSVAIYNHVKPIKLLIRYS